MVVFSCPSLWAAVCPDWGANRPAIHTTHCCRDRSDYLIRLAKNQIFMVINGPADGIECLSSWTRGATFWWICLKLREDSLPLQTGPGWASSRRTKRLDYPNDILLCCWLWHPNLAASSERLLAYPAVVKQWREPATTHQLQTSWNHVSLQQAVKHPCSKTVWRDLRVSYPWTFLTETNGSWQCG